MNITIYYGMSGALKGSTIGTAKKRAPDLKVMESSIKPWKFYQFGLFAGLIEYNDLTYTILHLVRLREFMKENHNSSDLLVERGVTDSLFYHYYNDEFPGGSEEDPKFIEDVCQAERTLLMPDFSKIKKVLLIQEDQEFVKDSVLKEEFRKKTFKDSPDYYFEMQEKYVNFTTKYNSIDEVIRINNARDYIVNVLGEDWNNNKV